MTYGWTRTRLLVVGWTKAEEKHLQGSCISARERAARNQTLLILLRRFFDAVSVQAHQKFGLVASCTDRAAFVGSARTGPHSERVFNVRIETTRADTAGGERKTQPCNC